MKHLHTIMLLLALAPGCKNQQKAAAPGATSQTTTDGAGPTHPTATHRGRNKPLGEKPSATDSVGIAECDEYLAKYERCIRDNVPKSDRPGMAKGLAHMRAAWKRAVLTEAGRQGLATACTTALHSASQAMAAYNCKW